MPVLKEVEQIDVYARLDRDILNFWLRPQELSWPVTAGRLWRDENDNLSVKLDAEEKVEWEYLRQHLDGNSIWDEINDWKRATAQDLSARRDLFNTLSRKSHEATGLPVHDKLEDDGGGKPCLHPYYVAAIYDQVISAVLGNRIRQKKPGDFWGRSEGQSEGKVSLGGFLVISGCNAEEIDRATNFFLEAQMRFIELREAKDVARLYSEADEKSSKLKRAVKRILLTPGPIGNCELCRPFLKGQASS